MFFNKSMLNLISKIQNTPNYQYRQSFKGTGHYKTKEAEAFCNELFKQKPLKTARYRYSPAPENHFKKIIANIKKFFTPLKLEAVLLKKYNGPMTPEAGLSTESGKGYGGGWIKAKLDTPLSTTDVQSCAALNLVNNKSGEHFLYHVYDETSAKQIENFILKEFPDFDKINITKGEMQTTKHTVKRIIQALDDINPAIEKNIFDAGGGNPEFVAWKGEMSYIPNHNGEDSVNYNKASFKEVAQSFT